MNRHSGIRNVSLSDSLNYREEYEKKVVELNSANSRITTLSNEKIELQTRLDAANQSIQELEAQLHPSIDYSKFDSYKTNEIMTHYEYPNLGINDGYRYFAWRDTVAKKYFLADPHMADVSFLPQNVGMWASNQLWETVDYIWVATSFMLITIYRINKMAFIKRNYIQSPETILKGDPEWGSNPIIFSRGWDTAFNYLQNACAIIECVEGTAGYMYRSRISLAGSYKQGPYRLPGYYESKIIHPNYNAIIYPITDTVDAIMYDIGSEVLVDLRTYDQTMTTDPGYMCRACGLGQAPENHSISQSGPCTVIAEAIPSQSKSDVLVSFSHWNTYDRTKISVDYSTNKITGFDPRTIQFHSLNLSGRVSHADCGIITDVYWDITTNKLYILFNANTLVAVQINSDNKIITFINLVNNIGTLINAPKTFHCSKDGQLYIMGNTLQDYYQVTI